MFEDYTVAVRVKLFNEVSGGLLLMSKQFESLTGKAVLFQKELASIKRQMMAGFGMIGGGFALAAPFIYAISKAAELQKQMIGIQIATGGTADQMDKLRVSIERASSTTIFSSLDVAKMAKLVSTSNTFSAPQLTALMPTIARFADVQAMMKGTPYSSSVLDAVKLMHLAQRYSPQDVAPYFDELTKATFMMPGGIGELRHALAYFMPMGKAALGVDDKSSIMIAALLNRLGLQGSRGGTNLLAAMTRTIPGVFGSGLLKGKSFEALSDMGFIDKKGHSKFMKNGVFDTSLWVQGLASFVHNAITKDPLHGRERVMIDLNHALGVQGSKVAGLLSSPQAIEQLNLMFEQFQKLAETGAIQNTFFQKSVAQQWKDSVTNFQNVMIELGMTLLPLATRGLHRLNDDLNILVDWMRKNHSLVRELAYGFLTLAAAMAFSGVLTLLVSGFRSMYLLVVALTIPFDGVLFMLTAFTAGLYGLYRGLKVINDFFGFSKTQNIATSHGTITRTPSSLTNLLFNPFASTLGTLSRASSANPIAAKQSGNSNASVGDVFLDADHVGKVVLRSIMGHSQLTQNSMPSSFSPSLTPISNGWSGN